MGTIEAYEAALSRTVLEGDGRWPGLRHIPGLTLYGPPGIPAAGRDPTFSFRLAGREDTDVARVLYSKYGLAVGAEDYFSRVPALFGLKTALRATFVHYNTPDDASGLLRALHKLARKGR